MRLPKKKLLSNMTNDFVLVVAFSRHFFVLTSIMIEQNLIKNWYKMCYYYHGIIIYNIFNF